MNISYKWLTEFVELTLAPQELAAALTAVGLAVEAVHESGDDFIFDIDLTSNRPDCLSHLGVAREIAVIEGRSLREPIQASYAIEGLTADVASVEIRDTDLCPRYSARIIRGVKIGPSPDWMVKRLESIGQRPINNVADVTNYVLHELGQPLHAFDLSKLHGHKIVVRRAVNGEKLKTLDSIERTLDEQMLVIADAERPVALAGIMGGEDSEISDETTDVLIESAYFAPASVRSTARRLALHTEASHRFERGTDPEGVLRAQERAAQLILEVAGGRATSDTLDVYPKPFIPRAVGVRPERVERITGIPVSAAEIQRILSALGFVLCDSDMATVVKAGVNVSSVEENKFEGQESLVYRAPSWRVDIEREEDLIEEVARHTGFDKIESSLPPTALAGEYQPSERRKRALRNSLKYLGFDEAINFSFIDASNDDRFELLESLSALEVAGERFVALTNPIIEGQDRMRPSLLPGLLNSVRHNFNHGNRDVLLFEVGQVFASAGAAPALPREQESLALVITGGAQEEGRAGTRREVDFYDLKGAVESASSSIGLSDLGFRPATVKHLREGQSAAIVLENRTVGMIGRLADMVSTLYKFRQPVYVAEVDLTLLLQTAEEQVRYSPVTRFPSVVRDVSLLVHRKVVLVDLLEELLLVESPVYRGAEFVDVYEGPNIPDELKSLTLRLEYRGDDRTLRDEEVDILHAEIVGKLQSRFDARVRT
jgi:phenylalanyl-tRNA synthetase beta chain